VYYNRANMLGVMLFMAILKAEVKKEFLITQLHVAQYKPKRGKSTRTWTSREIKMGGLFGLLDDAEKEGKGEYPVYPSAHVRIELQSDEDRNRLVWIPCAIGLATYNVAGNSEVPSEYVPPKSHQYKSVPISEEIRRLVRAFQRLSPPMFKLHS
jgi:hypothetical protein